MQRQTVVVAALTAALSVMPATAQWRPATSSTQGPNGSVNGQPIDREVDADNGPGTYSQRPDANGRGMNGPSDNRGDAGVARVSVADGDVEVLRGDTGDRMQARGGVPLIGNDSISTGRSSRAEVQLGPGNLIRLGEEARVRVVDVGNRYFRVEVLSGGVSFSQLKGSEADIDIMAPNTTVRPLKPGLYRVTVREGVQTDLTVRKGEAEIVSSRSGEKVKSGQRASVRGDRQSPELRMSSAEPKDSFDRWNERRDDILEPRYRNSGMMLGGGFGYPYGGFGGFGYPF